MKCTCPTKFDDHTRAIVRASLDQFCPIHGVKKQELPHCATCTCGAVPIVQTPEIAAQLAIAKCTHSGCFVNIDAAGTRICSECRQPVI